jgi:hypothetical protein
MICGKAEALHGAVFAVVHSLGAFSVADNYCSSDAG